MAFLKPQAKDYEYPSPFSGASQATAGPPTLISKVAEVQPASGPFAPAESRAQGTSVIGTDLTILGERLTIISESRLQIDGDIRGDVTGRQVTIGREGSVVGTVSAEEIEVLGGVRGAIRAQSVALHPTSQVEGEIVHQKLTIAEGAQFDGNVRRARDGAELVPNLDPNSYASRQGDWQQT